MEFNNTKPEEGNSNSNLKFGLNQNFTLTKFDFIDDAEKGWEAVDLEFQKDETKLTTRIFKIGMVYGKNNEKITDSNHKLFKAAELQLSQYLYGIFSIFVTDEVAQQALEGKTSFQEFIMAIQKMLPVSFKDVKLDLFLQYQNQLRGEATQTYLELPYKPNHVKYGQFIVKTLHTDWEEEKMNGKLRYKRLNGDKTEYHQFSREAWFYTGNFGIKQSNSDRVAPVNSFNTSTKDSQEALQADDLPF
jgi:serine protease inhibitor ecotin